MTEGFHCMLRTALLIVFPRDEVTFLMAQSFRDESCYEQSADKQTCCLKGIHSAQALGVLAPVVMTQFK